jgi:hypothetical protein
MYWEQEFFLGQNIRNLTENRNFVTPRETPKLVKNILVDLNLSNRL